MEQPVTLIANTSKMGTLLILRKTIKKIDRGDEVVTKLESAQFCPAIASVCCLGTSAHLDLS